MDIHLRVVAPAHGGGRRRVLDDGALLRVGAAVRADGRPREDEPSWTVTRRLEHAAWRQATMCVVPGQEMRRRILTDVPGLSVRVSPNGWDHALRRAGNQTAANGRRRVSFLGNYAWPLSEDAAVFLLERLWPQIRIRVPGRRPDRVLRADAHRDTAGHQDDAERYGN